MSNELIKIEIIHYGDDLNDHGPVEDLIEYVPDDGEFEQYEYIEIEEQEETQKSNVWKNIKPIVKSESETTTNFCYASGVKIEDKSLIIKLETDQYFLGVHDERNFKCSNRKCKRDRVSFVTQDELDQHNLIHLEQITANECPICNKILANQTKLNIHMETRHIPKSFTCDHCGKVFRGKDNLRLHMSHHRQYFTVECRACHKTYKSVQSLRYHLRQHFEHHQCETCGQVFEHKKLLLGHIASKHNFELQLQCRFCTRMFSRNDVREAHEKAIHQNGKTFGSHFKCKECDEAFDLRDELMRHKILRHYSGTLHTCEECDKSFKKKSLLDLHMSRHKEKSIRCEDCKMMFTFITGLSKHKKLNRCKGPQANLKNKSMMKEDMARIAKQQLIEMTVNQNVKTEITDLFSDLNEDGESKHTVAKAKKRPGRKRKAEESEVKIKSEIKSEIDLEDYSMDGLTVAKSRTPAIIFKKPSDYDYVNYLRSSNVETFMSSSGRIITPKIPFSLHHKPFKPINIPKQQNIPLECDWCGLKLSSKQKLKAHFNNHVRGRKHRCKKCSKTFCNVASLRKHCFTVHTGEHHQFKEKRCQCDECPKRYLTEYLLAIHKLSHKNLMDQKCPDCSFATNSPLDLKSHIKRKHMVVPQFPCSHDGCEKTFKRRCDMENHQKAVHSQIKVYVKCPVCEVIVLEKGLRSHTINRHSDKANYKPFVCTICGKAERYQKNLQRHIESVHDPVDRGVQYPCNECSEIFYRRRDLTRHVFDHYTGPTYECDECENKYKTKKELTTHRYGHRGNKYPCNLCEAVFQTQSGRAKHIKRHALSIDLQSIESLEVEHDETSNDY